jgi:hypothetical protein
LAAAMAHSRVTQAVVSLANCCASADWPDESCTAPKVSTAIPKLSTLRFFTDLDLVYSLNWLGTPQLALGIRCPCKSKGLRVQTKQSGPNLRSALISLWRYLPLICVSAAQAQSQ